jgi:hypothetical protein
MGLWRIIPGVVSKLPQFPLNQIAEIRIISTTYAREGETAEASAQAPRPDASRMSNYQIKRGELVPYLNLSLRGQPSAVAIA